MCRSREIRFHAFTPEARGRRFQIAESPRPVPRSFASARNAPGCKAGTIPAGRPAPFPARQQNQTLVNHGFGDGRRGTIQPFAQLLLQQAEQRGEKFGRIVFGREPCKSSSPSWTSRATRRCRRKRGLFARLSVRLRHTKAASHASTGTLCTARKAGRVNSGGPAGTSAPNCSLMGRMSCGGGRWGAGGFRGGNHRRGGRAAGMHGELHRRLRERAIGFCAGIKKTERKRRQFMNVRVLRRDDLLERFCAFEPSWSLVAILRWADRP